MSLTDRQEDRLIAVALTEFSVHYEVADPELAEHAWQLVANHLLEHSGSAIDLDFTPDSLLVAIAAFAVLAFVAVRLFFLPIAVLHVEPLRAAPKESWQRSRGHGAVLFALIVMFGLASGWLATLPYIGVVLSMAVVGTTHSISIAILYDQA